MVKMRNAVSPEKEISSDERQTKDIQRGENGKEKQLGADHLLLQLSWYYVYCQIIIQPTEIRLPKATAGSAAASQDKRPQINLDL